VRGWPACQATAARVFIGDSLLLVREKCGPA
jgi:hypothetical protein